MSTRARIRREIRSETISVVAEKVALLWTKSRVPRTIECDVTFRNFLQKSSWLQNAELQTILKAYFDESVNIRDFLDKIRGANANIVKAALKCTRLCVFRTLKQVQAMEETLEVDAMSAGNSAGVRPTPVKFIIEEMSVIEVLIEIRDRCP